MSLVGAQGKPPIARRARWRPPDYSTGMMAVVVALTMCDKVGWVRALHLAATLRNSLYSRWAALSTAGGLRARGRASAGEPVRVRQARREAAPLLREPHQGGVWLS